MHVFTFVYAYVFYIKRRSLWKYLVNFFASCVLFWCVLGNFNAMFGRMKRQGLLICLLLVMNLGRLLLLLIWLRLISKGYNLLGLVKLFPLWCRVN